MSDEDYRVWKDDLVSSKPDYEFEGDVYYDPRTNQFLQLRERHEDHPVFGKFCDFYRDAKTIVAARNQRFPLEYLEGLKKVERPEELEEAEYRETLGDWRVKDKKLDPTVVEN